MSETIRIFYVTEKVKCDKCNNGKKMMTSPGSAGGEFPVICSKCMGQGSVVKVTQLAEALKALGIHVPRTP